MKCGYGIEMCDIKEADKWKTSEAPSPKKRNMGEMCDIKEADKWKTSEAP
jgi:hypothetical protein